MLLAAGNPFETQSKEDLDGVSSGKQHEQFSTILYCSSSSHPVVPVNIATVFQSTSPHEASFFSHLAMARRQHLWGRCVVFARMKPDDKINVVAFEVM